MMPGQPAGLPLPPHPTPLPHTSSQTLTQSDYFTSIFLHSPPTCSCCVPPLSSKPTSSLYCETDRFFSFSLSGFFFPPHFLSSSLSFSPSSLKEKRMTPFPSTPQPSHTCTCTSHFGSLY
ncbi:hypothetical protein AALO_G00295480 [Alosa alosa]|uniref:Uncharacterized protein n=1 Tax=Alosa alosa TaxID=278164 RepID=A0AAV6FI07_9TELE|nr:hypothetical protein AALO_G00295480 [Alosa alosa]